MTTDVAEEAKDWNIDGPVSGESIQTAGKKMSSTESKGRVTNEEKGIDAFCGSGH